MSTQQFARRDRNGMAVIGRTLHQLRGIRFANGEDGNEGTPPATPPAPTPTPPAPTPPAPKPTPPAAPAPQQQPQEPASRTFDQEYVTTLREENKERRLAAEKAEKERNDAIAERDALKAQLAESKRLGVVSTIAPEVGGNVALLLDSEKFKTTFAEVNLDDTEAAKAAIKAFVEKNPAYAAGPQPPASSGEHTAGGGQPPRIVKSLSDAVATVYAGK